MKKYLLLTVIICSLFIFSGCRKENTPDCVAGTGGKVTLLLFPQHHGQTIYGATAYIKFNSKSLPSSLSDFDMTLEGEENEAHIHAENLKCGDYFIYCEGYDSTIAEAVRGGIPYTLSSATRGEVNVYVPVTE
jgi:hypothetical protein